LKKQIENIVSLIEGWCKKKIVFADPLLPFGAFRETTAHCTHLQIVQVETKPKFAKECNFSRRSNRKKVFCCILQFNKEILSLLSINNSSYHKPRY
jgi:hypothetical protein